MEQLVASCQIIMIKSKNVSGGTVYSGLVGKWPLNYYEYGAETQFLGNAV